MDFVHYSDWTYLLKTIFLNHNENQWQNESMYKVIFTSIEETNLIGKVKSSSAGILYIYRAKLMALGFVVWVGFFWILIYHRKTGNNITISQLCFLFLRH